MPVIGYLSILAGVLLIRQVAVGRARETPTDIRDLIVSAFRGDFAGVSAVTSQRGSVLSPVAIGSSVVTGGGSALESEMRRIGSGRPYVFGAEGPSAYDCSGLVWRALYNLGVYRGPRFTADSSMLSALSGKIAQVSSPAPGDIVLWSGHHVGVVTGPDRMFSALNSSDGIIESSISGNTSHYSPPSSPTYYRLTNG